MSRPILLLYNTETKKKEKILPSNNQYITMYACGPTVYDYAHIGNFRCYLFEDLLRRVLLYFDYPVKQVMNITDVDDKTIKGAIKNNISLSEYVIPFKKAFFEDLEFLHIQKAEHYPEATKYIPSMIKIIQKLLDNDSAYESEGSIYFSIAKFPSYGRLSHINLEELQKTQRIASDEYEKENVSDFVLWKAYDPQRDGKIFWDSPFGKGRPGWHIECSAMALQLLGETIDLHCGGVDNIFPHHENEIAQSESYTHKRFVCHWAHCQHLIVDGKKMSKSLGNFYTLRDLINKGYHGDEIRYALLSSHYRMQYNFTLQSLLASRSSLQRIRDHIEKLEKVQNATSSPHDHVVSLIAKTHDMFVTALADDLNIATALASIFDLVREINILLDQKQLSQKDAQSLLTFYRDIDRVIGCLFPLQKETIPQNIIEAVEKRQIARQEKNWKEADRLRDFIMQQGYQVEDTPEWS